VSQKLRRGWITVVGLGCGGGVVMIKWAVVLSWWQWEKESECCCVSYPWNWKWEKRRNL